MLKALLLSTVLLFSASALISTAALAAGADDFVLEVTTAADGESFTIPTNPAFTYNYNVDCGNGEFPQAGNTGDALCNYTTAGTYEIRISDNIGDKTGFPAIYVHNSGDRQKISSLDQWGTGRWAGMNSAFYGAINMLTPATDAPDLSNVTSMSAMFYFATIANPNTNGWDTRNVTDMSRMFRNASSANPNTSGWDTSKVTSMYRMFNGAASANPNTSGWDTSNVTNMRYMFFAATSANPNTSAWDTGNVTDMSDMFRSASSANPNSSGWDTGNVTDMGHMFSGASSANPDTSGWDMHKVTDMGHMFLNATSANPDTSSWDITHRPKMDDIFKGVTLPTASYDAMLIGFAAQDILDGDPVSFHGGNSSYCNGEAARNELTADDGWTFLEIDDKQCTYPTAAPNLIESSDTGPYNYDNITNDTTLTIEVSCLSVDHIIRVYHGGPGFIVASEPCTSIGLKNITLPSITTPLNLSYAVVITPTIITSPSPSLIVTIDVTSPPAPTCSTTPALAGPSVSVTTTCTSVETDAFLTIPSMQCGKESDNEVVCTGTVGEGIARISINNDTVTISDLAGNTNTSETTGLTTISNADCTSDGALNILDVACVIDIANNAGVAVNGANCDEFAGVDADDVICTIDKVLAAP